MSEQSHDALVSFLRDEFGDELGAVVRYIESESTVLHGQDHLEQYADGVDLRSDEQMHRDAVSRLQQTALAGDLYETNVYGEVTVTEDGTGLYLFPSDREGIFVWLGPGADVTVPETLDECLARLDGE
ncbi:MAG: hypothetical protein ABEJ40_03215 [Haloarculaceae archaeon]